MAQAIGMLRTLCRHVTIPASKRVPKRPARPAICFTSPGVSGRCIVPSNFSRDANTMRLRSTERCVRKRRAWTSLAGRGWAWPST